MASGAVQTHYPKRALAVVQDTSRRVTIQAFPKFKLVVITPVSAAGVRRRFGMVV